MKILLDILVIIILFSIYGWIAIIKDVFNIKKSSSKIARTIGFIFMFLVILGAAAYMTFTH